MPREVSNGTCIEQRFFSKGNEATAATLLQQIESQGGTEGYQKASLLGQTRDRGGESSKI
jgi:hypothetical protein